MRVVSTRGGQTLTSLQAVLQGIATDGGLFVPESFPRIDLEEAAQRTRIGYSSLCAYVLSLFFDLGEEELERLAADAYRSFDTNEVVPLHMLPGDEYVMELTHGPTLAFKDMALQVLPRLTQAALEKEEQSKNVLILTATSGDTGKAALEGFMDVARTAIFVFYPESGVAKMQKLQMVTQTGNNTGVSAVVGNFDDAQTGVKKLFADQEFQRLVGEKGYALSSANSINFGRLVPQIAYYVYGYAKLRLAERIAPGQEVNYCVPTGNFGNILAAYYARRMGIPIGKLICASNTNNVLTDFFRTGEYTARRAFHKTMSPSMDILISSNLERLLFELADRDAERVTRWMTALSAEGSYAIGSELVRRLQEFIWADWLDEEETAQVIRGVFDAEDYLMDPHTAVAQGVFTKYRAKTGDKTPVITVSTANPYKFTPDVLESLTGRIVTDAFAAAAELSEITHTEIPPQISELEKKPILHDGVVSKEDMGSAVMEFLARLVERPA